MKYNISQKKLIIKKKKKTPSLQRLVHLMKQSGGVCMYYPRLFINKSSVSQKCGP